MKYKTRLGLLSVLICAWANIVCLANSLMKVEKLAEHDAIEVMALLNDNAFQKVKTTTFKGKPLAVTIDSSDTDGLSLYSLSVSQKYNKIENHEFFLKDIVARDTDYDLSLAANDHNVYALLTNNDDKIRTKKNLLLKSSDGVSWELYQSFPAEWELSDLNVDQQNLSLTCLNCEDNLKTSYIISHDAGKSWNKYSLPVSNKAWHFSGFANSNLYVVAEIRDPQDRNKLVNQIFFTQLDKKTPTWTKADLTNVATLEKDSEFKFHDVETLLAADGYLLAVANYVRESDETGELTEATATWISRDDGNTWHFFQMQNLQDEVLVQFTKHGEHFHLVTNNNIDAPDFEDDDLSSLEAMIKYVSDQKYAYYRLTKTDLDNTKGFKLIPSVQLEHGFGYNLDYKVSKNNDYVDALFISYTKGSFKLGFYRLHNQ